MIKLLTETLTYDFLRICKKDVAGLRIASTYEAYGAEYDFCQFWVQIADDGLACAIMRVDGDVTISGEIDNEEELKEFLGAIGYNSVYVTHQNIEKLKLPKHKTGRVLQLKNGVEVLDSNVNFEPKLKDVYDILKKCPEHQALTENYETWYADVLHKIRHEKAMACLLVENDENVACAMVLAQSNSSALVGAVAVDPEKRRQGFGKKVVCAICGKLIAQNKQIVLCREDGKNEEFYEKLGFADIGGWATLISEKI